MPIKGPIAKMIKDRVLKRFMSSLSYSRKNIIDVLLTDRPFDFSLDWHRKFFEAMKYSFEHHYAHSDYYKRLCKYKNFDASRLQSFDDLWDIPYLLSDVFKHVYVETRTINLLRTEMTSSGTLGRKSRVALDMLSAQRLLYSIYHIYKSLGVVAPQAITNYIMMAYNPELDDTRSTTTSDVVISCLAPKKSLFYALDIVEPGGVEFLKEKTVNRLRSFVEENLPIRVLGFLHHTCEAIKAYNEKFGILEFPKDSFILSGGGWKTFAHLYGQQFDLFNFLKERTSIDTKNVRDLYTLNEHAVFYAECEEHNKHIPNVAIACARDPRTLERLPYGKVGLIHLYSPLLESAPVLSMLTTDYGVVEKSCPCKIGGPYLKIIGRAGITKKATCTLTADQYIKS